MRVHLERFVALRKVIYGINNPCAAFALFLALPALAELNPESTTPLPPFQIADNLYYVGSQDLAAFLMTTPAGNVLINATLETSPPQIRASVLPRRLSPPPPARTGGPSLA